MKKEHYQPIYGEACLHARNCSDREVVLDKLFSKITDKLKRKISVLDIGCAYGYFLFSLDRHLDIGIGLDTSEENIKICNKIKSEKLFYKQEFFNGNIIDFDFAYKFDVVLCLSVLQHVTHSIGFIKTAELIKRISEHSTILISELALKSEPGSWNVSLPPQPEDYFKSYKNSQKISEFITPVATTKRPVFFSSNKYRLDNEWNLLDI